MIPNILETKLSNFHTHWVHEYLIGGLDFCIYNTMNKKETYFVIDYFHIVNVNIIIINIIINFQDGFTVFIVSTII